jgi:four helix bundle protein
VAGIDRFEDIRAWQAGRQFVSSIYRISSIGEFRTDFALRDQIRRAALGVPSNIAEGFERDRPREFHQFLSIAKGSCAEVRSDLYVALDVGHITKSEFRELIAEGESVANQIGAFRADLERRHNLR